MSELAHLGLCRPVRNARTEAVTDFVAEYIRLKSWARQQYGQHSQRAKDNRPVPRLSLSDARKMLDWWAKAASDVKRTDRLGDTINNAVALMKQAAYGGSRSGELSFEQAATFWTSMHELAISLGPAKARPSTMDKLQMLVESYGESITELPGRVLNAVETGVELAEDASEGMGKLVTGLKWTGIIGGGLAGLYLVTRLMPKRSEKPA